MAGEYVIASVTVIDYEKDKSVMTFYPASLGVGGAIDWSVATQNADEIKDAIAYLSAGTVVGTNVTQVFPEGDINPPASKEANNASKYIITMQDQVDFLDALNAVPNAGFRRFFKMEVAVADGSLLASNEKTLRLDDAAIKTNVVDVLEANIRSFWNKGTVQGGINAGPAVKVMEIRRAGRNV